MEGAAAGSRWHRAQLPHPEGVLLAPWAVLNHGVLLLCFPCRRVQTSMWVWIYLLRASPSTSGKDGERGHQGRGDHVWKDRSHKVLRWRGGLLKRAAAGRRLLQQWPQQGDGVGPTSLGDTCGPDQETTPHLPGQDGGWLGPQAAGGCGSDSISVPSSLQPPRPPPPHCALLQASSQLWLQRWLCCSLQEQLGTTGLLPLQFVSKSLCWSQQWLLLSPLHQWSPDTLLHLAL